MLFGLLFYRYAAPAALIWGGAGIWRLVVISGCILRALCHSVFVLVQTRSRQACKSKYHRRDDTVGKAEVRRQSEKCQKLRPLILIQYCKKLSRNHLRVAACRQTAGDLCVFCQTNPILRDAATDLSQWRRSSETPLR